MLVWLKKESLLLPFAFLVALGINVFIALCNNPMTYYRNTMGHFELDRNYMIAAAAVNIVLSIVLSFPLGVTGVVIATIFGHLLIFAGRTVVVFRHIIEKSEFGYYALFALRLGLLAASCALSLFLGSLTEGYISNLILSVIVKGIISVVVSMTIFVITSVKTRSFKVISGYVKKVLKMVGRKSAADE